MEIKNLLDRFIFNGQSPNCLLPREAASKGWRESGDGESGQGVDERSVGCIK